MFSEIGGVNNDLSMTFKFVFRHHRNEGDKEAGEGGDEKINEIISVEAIVLGVANTPFASSSRVEKGSHKIIENNQY